MPSSTTRPSLARRLGARLLALAVGLLLGLLAAELLVRVAGLGVPARGPSNALASIRLAISEERVPDLQYALKPSSSESVLYPGLEGDDRTVEYRINALGLRDVERAAKPAPGTRRLLALGDSFTFGTGVELADTWPQQLERELQRVAPGQRFEVLNGGVFAYNTRQEVSWFQARGPELAPELALLMMYINDASGELAARAPAEPQAKAWELSWIEHLGLTSGIWALTDKQSPEQARAMAWRRRSVLIDLACYELYNALEGRVALRNYHADWEPDSAGFKEVESSLRRARDFARQQGIALHVAVYPDLSRLDQDYPFAAEHARIGQLCQELGLPFHDAFEALAGQDPALLRVHAHDHHPNGAANALVAAWLARRLAPQLQPPR